MPISLLSLRSLPWQPCCCVRSTALASLPTMRSADNRWVSHLPIHLSLGSVSGIGTRIAPCASAHERCLFQALLSFICATRNVADTGQYRASQPSRQRHHSASRRARSTSRRRSAAAPGETRCARLSSGLPPWSSAPDRPPAGRPRGTACPRGEVDGEVGRVHRRVSSAARIASGFHSRLRSRSGSSSSAPRPRPKAWKIAPLENCRSRW